MLFVSVLVEHHAHREAGPRLLRLQGAEVVGDALRQHRHHAVGEIDGVAAGPRFLVERASGPDIGGDVGDGHHHHPAALVAWVGVGLGPYRIVAVAGVGRIDGDEGEMPQIFPALQIGRDRRFRLAEHGFGKGVGDAVGVDGDKARRPLILRIAETIRDADVCRAKACGAGELEADQLAVLRVLRRPARDPPLFQLLAVDGIDDAGRPREG